MTANMLSHGLTHSHSEGDSPTFHIINQGVTWLRCATGCASEHTDLGPCPLRGGLHRVAPMKRSLSKLLLAILAGGVLSSACIVHPMHGRGHSRREMKAEHKHKHDDHDGC